MILAAGAAAAIFMFHHVSAHAASGPFGRALTVTPQEFERQLQYLRDRGCAAVGLDRLIADTDALSLRTCEVALTFDDGYADAATEAAPLLRHYGDVGTFFIATGYLGVPGHVTAAEVRALARDGMQIGAHTVTHPDLTALPASSVAHELVASRTRLRAVSGQPVAAFAYPAGRFDASVETAVRDAGFLSAVTTNAGALSEMSLRRDKFALPRYRVLRDRGEALMRQVLASSGDPSVAASEAAVHSIARQRIEGNAPGVAERVAVAVLSAGFPEQILKVRVYQTSQSAVAGIMLSGVKFHATVDRQTFAADAADMIYRAFAADAAVSEVDVWAIVPIAVAHNATVSGDLAVPTSRTVFSAAVQRADWALEQGGLGKTYWEPGFLESTTR